MATTLKPEMEAKLNQLAERTHRSKEEALEEALNQALAYNEWLEAKVSESIAAVERGETVANEEVCGWIERREAESADSEFKPSQILRERR